MDQDAFRKTYKDINEQFCAFERSLLTNQCQCSMSERFCIAEREGVHCKSRSGQKQCLELLAILRKQTRFALKTNDDKPMLPYGQAMKIQVGGLKGIQLAIDPTLEYTPVKDVYGLIAEATRIFGSLDALPFQTIIQSISAYKLRKRRTGRK